MAERRLSRSCVSPPPSRDLSCSFDPQSLPCEAGPLPLSGSWSFDPGQLTQVRPSAPARTMITAAHVLGLSAAIKSLLSSPRRRSLSFPIGFEPLAPLKSQHIRVSSDSYRMKTDGQLVHTAQR